MRFAQAAFRVFEEERRPVHVAAACAAAQDGEVLQNLRLQRAAQPFHALETVLARGLLQFCERDDPQLFVELEDLVRPQARYGEHLKDSGRDFLAHRFKAGMCARAVKLRDDIGNGVADARNFREPILRDDLVQWHRKGGDAVGRAGHRPWPGKDCRRAGTRVRRIPGEVGRQ